MKLGLTFVLLFSFALLFSQNAKEKWHLKLEKNGIQIFYKKGTCTVDKKGYYFLKIKNNNNATAVLSWKNEIYFGDNCRNCNTGSEHFGRMNTMSSNSKNRGTNNLNRKYYDRTYTIAANSEVQGDCDSESESLKIFYKSTGSKNYMSKFELGNFKVDLKLDQNIISE